MFWIRTLWVRTPSSMLIFWGIPSLFSIVADSICNPPTVHRSSLFSTSSPTLTFSPLDDGHSSRYEMISHWRFDLCFPDNWWYWAFFLTFWLFVWLPQKIVYSVPLSIFKLHSLGFFFHCYWVLWFVWLLTDVLFANIVSHFLGWLFILLIVSFAVLDFKV